MTQFQKNQEEARQRRAALIRRVETREALSGRRIIGFV